MPKHFDYLSPEIPLKHNEILQKVNIETGEVTEIMNHLNSNPNTSPFDFMAKVNYNEFGIINFEALESVLHGGDLLQTDITYFFDMALTMKTKFQILMTENNKPYTIELMAERLKVHYVSCTKIFKRLTAVGLIGKLEIIDKSVFTINPFFIKSTKYISLATIDLFKGLSFDSKISDVKIETLMNSIRKEPGLDMF